MEKEAQLGGGREGVSRTEGSKRSARPRKLHDWDVCFLLTASDCMCLLSVRFPFGQVLCLVHQGSRLLAALHTPRWRGLSLASVRSVAASHQTRGSQVAVTRDPIVNTRLRADRLVRNLINNSAAMEIILRVK